MYSFFKKIKIFTLLITLCCWGACQSGSNSSSILDKEDAFERVSILERGDSSVYNGKGDKKHLQKVEKYYKNKEKQLKESYVILDGQKEGAFIAFFRNGAVQKTGTYQAGKKTGKWEYFTYTKHDAPTIKEKVEHFDNGLRNGLTTEWYENGQKKSEMTYKNGNQHGEGKMWHSNGQLKSKGVFIDNTPDGEMVLYYENGQMQAKVTYENGQRVGIMKDWYPNKQLKRTLYFKDGKRHGPVKAWSETGVLKAEGKYEDNELTEMKEY